MKRLYPAILSLLAICTLAQAQAPEAIEFYRKGYDLLRAKNFRNAAIELENATQADTTYGAAYYALAQAYKFLDEYDKSITAYKAAGQLGIKPDRIPQELGRLYHKSGVKSFRQRKFAEAIGYLENALIYEPDKAEFHYIIGLCYIQLNNSDAAVKAYQAAIKTDATYLKAYIALGDLHLRDRNFGPAAEAYDRAIAVDSTAVQAYGGRAKVQIETQDLEGAVTTLNKAVEVDKKFAQGYLLLGTALNQLGRQHQAIDPLLQAVKLDGKNAEAHYRLSEAYYGKAEYPLAIEAGKRAVSKRKDYHAAQVAVADAYTKLLQLGEARSWYNRAKDDNRFKDYCQHQLEELDRIEKRGKAQ